jgi:hypothetical protein
MVLDQMITPDLVVHVHHESRTDVGQGATVRRAYDHPARVELDVVVGPAEKVEDQVCGGIDDGIYRDTALCRSHDTTSMISPASVASRPLTRRVPPIKAESPK